MTYLSQVAPVCAATGVAFEVVEVVDRRILVDHDGLRIVLHGGGDGDQRKAVGVPLKDLVAGAEAEVGLAAGHLLGRAAVLRQGKNGHVEAFGLVVAEKLRGEEAAMLGLRIPVELQAHGREAAAAELAWLAVATGHQQSKGS